MIGPKRFTNKELNDNQRQAKALDAECAEADAEAIQLCEQASQRTDTATDEIRGFLRSEGLEDMLRLDIKDCMFSPVNPDITYKVLEVSVRGDALPLPAPQQAQTLLDLYEQYQSNIKEPLRNARTRQIQRYNNLLEQSTVEKLDFFEPQD
ncbi:hypothetical protein KY363_08355, partial [Candidatus Woesearchaeota archaeon]|nr:hypothetical protein [Candidatus Woesearchaeota archaeon]